MKLKLTLGLLAAAFVVLFPARSMSVSNVSETKTVVFTADNTIVLNSVIDGESVGAVIVKAKELDRKLSSVKEKISGKRPLYLFLDSPGGSVESGLELIESLKGLGRPVHTVSLFSASMAFQLVQNLDDRLVLRNGKLMSHHAAGQVGGSFGGQAASLDSRYKFWLNIIKEMDEQTVLRTKGKQTYESYTKQYDPELWLTGSQAVSEGYADAIVTVKCDSSLDGVQTKKILFMGLEISYDLDNCPLNTAPMNIRASYEDGRPAPEETLKKARENLLAELARKNHRTMEMAW